MPSTFEHILPLRIPILQMGKVRFTDVEPSLCPQTLNSSDLSSRGSDTHTHPCCCRENIPLAVEDEEVRERHRGGRLKTWLVWLENQLHVVNK